jgi:hypothetical protein
VENMLTVGKYAVTEKLWNECFLRSLQSGVGNFQTADIWRRFVNRFSTKLLVVYEFRNSG